MSSRNKVIRELITVTIYASKTNPKGEQKATIRTFTSIHSLRLRSLR